MAVRFCKGFDELDIPRLAYILRVSFNQFTESQGWGPEFPPESNVPLIIVKDYYAWRNESPGFVADISPEDEDAVGSLDSLSPPPPSASKNYVGVNFIDCRSSSIAHVGPLGVLPGIADRGVGRKLMQMAIDEAKQRNYRTLTLTQFSSSSKSFSLYSTMGFVPVETLAFYKASLDKLKAKLHSQKPFDATKYLFKAANASDVPACSAFYRQVTNNVDRDKEIEAMLAEEGHQPFVLYEKLLPDKLVVKAYSSDITSVLGHLVADSMDSVQTFFSGLVTTVDSLPTGLVGFHVIWRLYPELSLWCLLNGFKLERQMTLMICGDRQGFDIENFVKGSIYCPNVDF